eukprot:GHVU01004231.1.p1 GENE.GHVU01004231.1~~GHVU01004231.1.p1  ORF type:complete len:173 (+),score=14.15 GHVU01004231.1:139-657(+)
MPRVSVGSETNAGTVRIGSLARDGSRSPAAKFLRDGEVKTALRLSRLSFSSSSSQMSQLRPSSSSGLKWQLERRTSSTRSSVSLRKSAVPEKVSIPKDGIRSFHIQFPQACHGIRHVVNEEGCEGGEGCNPKHLQPTFNSSNARKLPPTVRSTRSRHNLLPHFPPSRLRPSS